ncbi:hypothetical protein BLOT_016858 [Blomia tropicalis]|nr:hypothetical protein BLOT_016858 [Blomia tropicalis]
MTFTYYLLFLLNVTLLGSIIFICGAVVHQQIQHWKQMISLISRFKVNQSKYFHNIFKINNMVNNMEKMSQSGFNTLNGYVITHDTYRALIVNITLYFILMIK